MKKRYFGDLTVTLPDGYVEHCIINERSYKRFIERLEDALEIILESAPEGNVQVKYRGDYANLLYDYLSKKTVEKLRNHEVRSRPFNGVSS